jgi:hypothetical protein
MNSEFGLRLQATMLSGEEIAARTAAIHAAALDRSNYLDDPNFTVIHPDDLSFLFEEYDRRFFEGGFAQAVNGSPLHFRLSPRLTSAGGKTTRFRPRRGEGPAKFEIAVSTTLLFQTFDDLKRDVVVTGILCRNRLEALQRIFEHELVHLAEMLAWDGSSCKATRFQSIARRCFGHTDHRHQLITPRERAMAKFGVRPGRRVRFRFNGRELSGIVNRITRRATVLVEDPKGAPFSDGRRYLTYYVPPEMLQMDGESP